MANKTKVGLAYFPFEVNFFKDIKLRKLIKYQGCKATPIYTLLLCNIYENGYYLRWDNELPFMISETTGYEEAFIKEVFTCCLKVDLFNEKMFNENKIITSKGIQERYRLICKQVKRKVNISEYNLIDSEEMTNNTERMPIDSEEMLQSKVKEIKEKENKGNLYKENFFYIGTEIYKTAISKFILQSHVQFLEVWQMQNREASVSEILAKMDKECVGTCFSDDNHIQNMFKLTAKNLIKEKYFENKNNGKSTNKTADTISNAHTILERRGIDPNKFIQQTNNG